MTALLKMRYNLSLSISITKSVNAINTRDFSYVEGLMTNDGPRKKEAKDYINHLESKGITQQFINVTVEKVEVMNTNTWKVTTTDEFIIFINQMALRMESIQLMSF